MAVYDTKTDENDSASDVFTCNGNGTLFRLFAPAGTPAENGVADNDQQGWLTWMGQGCCCQNGQSCCEEGSEIALQYDNFGLLDTDTSDKASPALAINYFWSLDEGTYGRNGAAGSYKKRQLAELSSNAYGRLSEKKKPRAEKADNVRLQAVAVKSTRRDIVADEEYSIDKKLPIVQRAEHNAAWNKYAPKGHDLW